MKKSALAIMIILACLAVACNVALAKQKFHGIVEQMPEGGYTGQWIISGRIVNATSTTRFKEHHGRLQVGASVEVEGFEADGNFLATEIKAKTKK